MFYNIGFWISKILINIGFAVVLVLIIRKIFRFEKYITSDHIEIVNLVILGLSLATWIMYPSEVFTAWYNGYSYELMAFYNRALGSFWWIYFLILFGSIVATFLLMFRKIRRSFVWTFIILLMINSMFIFERLVIISISMHRDYLPSSWEMY